MNTRKKCIECGLIGFAADGTCKRCGSNKLFRVPMPQALPPKSVAVSKRALPFWVYSICFILACVIEFVALLPVLANIGWRHSANAPKSEFEINSEFAAFILHLPTSALAYVTVFLDGGLLFLLTPLIQIIFWTFMFTKLWRRMNSPSSKLK